MHRTAYATIQTGRSLRDIGPILKNPILYQRGYGNYPLLLLYKNQRGRGVGSIFSGLIRYLKPLVFKGLKSVAAEALHSGSDILENMNGTPIKEVVKNRSKQALQNLKRKAIDTLMKGSGPRKRIKRMRQKKNVQSVAAIRKGSTLKPKRKPKRKIKNIDIFD